MKKQKNTISSMLRDLERANKILKEAYIFDGKGDEDGEAAIGYNEEDGGEMPPMDDEMPHEENGVGSMVADSGVDDEMIKKIRDAALEGIEKYKDNVLDSKYELYKSIFMSIDKFINDTLKTNDKSGK